MKKGEKKREGLIRTDVQFSAGFDCLKMSLGTFDMSLDHLCGIPSAAGPCTANIQLSPSQALVGGNL